jgi:hypothetical protein
MGFKSAFKGLSRYTVSTFAETLRLNISTDHSMHLPPSSVEVKNKWSYTFALPIYLNGVVKEVFALKLMD